MTLTNLCRPLGLAALVLVAGSPVRGQPATDTSLQEGDAFPVLAAETLAESRVELPRALQEKPAIVIMSFSKAGGEAASKWTVAIRERLSGPVTSNLWLAMVLDGVPRFLRGFVVGGIKRGIPDAMHPRTLTLYENGESWKRRCAIESDDAPCVILLDAGSLIRWIRAAPVTDALIDALASEVRALQ